MKILILQLARLGDIYLSWPTVRAIRRSQPDAEVTILTRERFQKAWEGCDPKIKILNFETKTLLSPMICDLPDVQESFRRTDDWLKTLEGENFEQIINLSFSPLSSYITHRLSAHAKQVSGYSRTSDGYLSIPDDMSAYFYAQVGPGRPNRFHLAEIFGTLASCDLAPEDWRKPQFLDANPVRNGIVLHIGASEARKGLGASKWATICQHLARVMPGKTISLVGSREESDKAVTIMNSVSSPQIVDFVGKTDLTELVKMIDRAEILLGCDSAPMHIASLTQTPCLNISLPSVNFWETGPRAPGSRILRTESEEELPSEKVALVASQILAGTKSDISVVGLHKGYTTPSYSVLEPRKKDFQWKILQSIYRGQAFPQSSDPNFHDALVKLEEVNRLVMDQLTFVERGGDLKNVAGVLNGAESIIQAIADLCAEISPLIRWYQTEKLRILPGAEADVLKRTIEIHELMMAAIEVLMESALAPEIGDTP